MSVAPLWCVMTTIQAPTGSARELVRRLPDAQARLVVVGDAKGPDAYAVPDTDFLSLATQLESPFEIARRLPTGHYTRKNVGYLHAIAAGAGSLYETDDDNAPLEVWGPRSLSVEARRVDAPGWVNVYRCFSDDLIWPRGLPLDAIVPSRDEVPRLGPVERVDAPIQQGLANGSPDVDAVWRLVLDRPFTFDRDGCVAVGEGSWCPFNSQSTWWWPPAYALLYLPSRCSFRMTDIWRSFVAQRCLWALGAPLVFHGAEVFQERNEHDLMRDFADETSGYLGNRAIASCLEAVDLRAGEGAVGDNLMRCYEALVAAGHFPAEELDLVRAWLDDLARCRP